jgi:hypothetical protein
MPGRFARKATSKAPAWVAPSAPPARPGRWQSAPAGAGSPRHARPDRSRAAGRWNRSRRTASSPRRQPGAEGHRMLFGNPHIESTASGKRPREQVQPGAIRHRRGDGDDLVVPLGLGDQALREDLGIAARSTAPSSARRSPRRTCPRMALVGRPPRRGHSPCPSSSAHGSAPAPWPAPSPCAGPAEAGPDHARRSGRHRKTPAPRTGCRRPPCPSASPWPASRPPARAPAAADKPLRHLLQVLHRRPA